MMNCHKIRVAALITVALVLITACGCKKQSPVQPLPASNEVAGWEKTGETRTYTAATLSDYIDGGADQYLKAGFKNVSTSDYKFEGKIEAVADVYVMANADAARTIFEADPSGSAKTVPLGDAARASSQSVVFRRGPFLVRIVAYQETPETPQALQQLGQGIEKRLSK
jgi:hypothetical protein